MSFMFRSPMKDISGINGSSSDSHGTWASIQCSCTQNETLTWHTHIAWGHSMSSGNGVAIPSARQQTTSFSVMALWLPPWSAIPVIVHTRLLSQACHSVVILYASPSHPPCSSPEPQILSLGTLLPHHTLQRMSLTCSKPCLASQCPSTSFTL